MLDRPFFISLLALNFLQFLWLFSYKKVLSLRETILMTIILVVQFLVGFLTDDHLVILLLIPLFILQFLFPARRIQNWLIPALFLSFENAIVLLSWLLTLDLWDILLIYHLISAEIYANYLNLFIFLQQFIFCLLLAYTNYLNKRFNITKTLHLLPKKYRFLAILLLFSLFFTFGLQQFSVLEGYSAPFFIVLLLSFALLLFLAGIFCLLLRSKMSNSILRYSMKNMNKKRKGSSAPMNFGMITNNFY
ncbi:hypothetical protein GQR36_01355 [Enterococcus termitis]